MRFAPRPAKFLFLYTGPCCLAHVVSSDVGGPREEELACGRVYRGKRRGFTNPKHFFALKAIFLLKVARSAGLKRMRETLWDQPWWSTTRPPASP